MNKVAELLDAITAVITNIRDLANSLQIVADVLTDIKELKTSEQPASRISEKVSNSKKKKAYTLEDVRGVLAEKSQNGLTSEVRGLIAKFGGSKLSDIDPSNYEAIIKEAEVLGNE